MSWPESRSLFADGAVGAGTAASYLVSRGGIEVERGNYEETLIHFIQNAWGRLTWDVFVACNIRCMLTLTTAGKGRDSDVRWTCVEPASSAVGSPKSSSTTYWISAATAKDSTRPIMRPC